jgi:hypothetical protein
MTIQDQINQAAAGLTEPQLVELLDFARFLRLQQEKNDWRAAGQAQFAKAYGSDEPEYTETDLRTQGQP